MQSDNATDTRIFSRELDCLRRYISKSYRGVRCPICSTMQDDAELVHAEFTHDFHNACAELNVGLLVFVFHLLPATRLSSPVCRSFRCFSGSFWFKNKMRNNNFPLRSSNILLIVR